MPDWINKTHISDCRVLLRGRRGRRLFDLPREDLLRELNRLDGLPQHLLKQSSFIEPFLPTIRADLQCREEWHGEIRELALPIHALGGSGDHLVHRSDLEEWQRYSSVPLQVRMFDGAHFFIRSHRHEVVSYLTQISLG